MRAVAALVSMRMGRTHSVRRVLLSNRFAACEVRAMNLGALAVASALLQSALHLRDLAGYDGAPSAEDRGAVFAAVGGGWKGGSEGCISEHELAARGLEQFDLDGGEAFDEGLADLDDLEAESDDGEVVIGGVCGTFNAERVAQLWSIEMNPSVVLQFDKVFGSERFHEGLSQ
jgi:hypothetical protein